MSLLQIPKLAPENYTDKKFCLGICRKRDNMRVEMILSIEDNWHMCPRCKGVQPITTNIPLDWHWCPNVIDGKTCFWPVLVPKGNQGKQHKCKKCDGTFTLGA